MILSFKSEETRIIFNGGTSKQYPPDLQRSAHRKLLLIASVEKIESLRIPPGNRLEKLRGDREGQWSIRRVNDQWRTAFGGKTPTMNPVDVPARWMSNGRLSLRKTMDEQQVRNIHPGEILLEEFLKPMGISPYKLAKDIGVGRVRISEIVRGQRDITADTAIRLGLYFGIEPEFWLNLQSRYNLVQARNANPTVYASIGRAQHAA